MKKFILLLLLSASFIAAQSQINPVFVKTEKNTLYNVSWEGNYRTADSTTFHTVGTIPVATNEVGVIEVEVVGIDTTSTGGFVVGKQVVNYSKASGTLTLATPTNILAKTTSVSCITSTWDITTSSNNLIVRVRGTLNREILWTVRAVQWKKLKP
jgi:hypothetical protein